MTTETKTANLVAWNGETYKGTGDYYEAIRLDESLHLDADEALRLAIYAYNCASGSDIDFAKLLEEEQEAFAGQNASEADFTEELLTEVGDLESMPSWVVIDWQATWDSALRFDFFTYDVVNEDGEYVKFFWRAY
jgi:hypothetical protein